MSLSLITPTPSYHLFPPYQGKSIKREQIHNGVYKETRTHRARDRGARGRQRGRDDARHTQTEKEKGWMGGGSGRESKKTGREGGGWGIVTKRQLGGFVFGAASLIRRSETA
jgi:hypothetical protein